MMLAYGITLGFFAVLGYILWRGLPQDNEAAKNVILVLVGSLGSAWTSGVIGYYFGSSVGSRAKDQTILNNASDGSQK
jgi:hypothetical protein